MPLFGALLRVARHCCERHNPFRVHGLLHVEILTTLFCTELCTMIRPTARQAWNYATQHRLVALPIVGIGMPKEFTLKCVCVVFSRPNIIRKAQICGVRASDE